MDSKTDKITDFRTILNQATKKSSTDSHKKQLAERFEGHLERGEFSHASSFLRDARDTSRITPAQVGRAMDGLIQTKDAYYLGETMECLENNPRLMKGVTRAHIGAAADVAVSDGHDFALQKILHAVHKDPVRIKGFRTEHAAWLVEKLWSDNDPQRIIPARDEVPALISIVEASADPRLIKSAQETISNLIVKQMDAQGAGKSGSRDFSVIMRKLHANHPAVAQPAIIDGFSRVINREPLSIPAFTSALFALDSLGLQQEVVTPAHIGLVMKGFREQGAQESLRLAGPMLRGIAGHPDLMATVKPADITWLVERQVSKENSNNLDHVFQAIKTYPALKEAARKGLAQGLDAQHDAANVSDAFYRVQLGAPDMLESLPKKQMKYISEAAAKLTEAGDTSHLSILEYAARQHSTAKQAFMRGVRSGVREQARKGLTEPFEKVVNMYKHNEGVVRTIRRAVTNSRGSKPPVA